MLDTFHMSMEEKTIPAAIRAAGSHLVHFQANENDQGFVGTGSVDWPAVAAALQVMADCSRIEVTNVETVTWYRDPGFKIGDPAASLDGSGETRLWQPNLTAARNEDPKGYAALLAAFVAWLNDAPAPPLPQIADGVRAMQGVEAMRLASDTGRPQAVG